MRGPVFVVAALVCFQVGPFGQGLPSTPIALTDKITSLDGVWLYDLTRGIKTISACSTGTVEQSVRIRVSLRGVDVEEGRPKGALLPLDGSPVTVNGTVATATLDAGWLAITMRTPAPMGRASTNVRRDVYVVDHDELTIWRNFTIEWPDGSLSNTVCSYREALVYKRQQ